MAMKKVCEHCETEAARFWLSVTDANGIVLVREALCRRCTEEMHLTVGTPAPEYPVIND